MAHPLDQGINGQKENDLVIKHFEYQMGEEIIIDPIFDSVCCTLTRCTAAWLERGMHANTKPGICLVFHPFLSTLTFHSTAACHLASYLITVWAWTVNSEYTVVLSLHSWISSDRYGSHLQSATLHTASIRPENRESERGRRRTPLVSKTMAASLGAVETHLNAWW